MNIILYGTEGCPYCRMAKDFFEENNIVFTYYDVGKDKEKAREMIDKSGQRAVPVIDAGGKIITGYDREELDRLVP